MWITGIHYPWYYSIDLVTVFDAILTSRQTREKLQCLYENLMSNNFRRTAVLKKYELWTKASFLGILLQKIEGVTCAKRPRTTFLMHLRKSRENYRQIYGKSKANLWRNLGTGTPPNVFRTILCFVALVYNWYFVHSFYGNYSTLDSHTNTVISQTFAYSSRWRRKP